MSAVHSAKGICDLALRAINAFPITESSADESHLREAMTWLDIIMAEIAGTTRLFNFVPQTVSFPLLNGTSTYALNAALGINLPPDQVQFPVEAFVITPQGNSVLSFGSAIPGTVAVGQSAADITTAAAIPPGTTVLSINSGAQQITLSAPSVVNNGDNVSFGGAAPISCAGTLNLTGMVAGVAQFRRRPLPLLPRDEFSAAHYPEETGPPRVAYLDRLPAPNLTILPTPAATDPQLHILAMDVQTYAPNVAPAGVTGAQPQSQLLTGFRQAWQRWLVFQLASDLGSGPVLKLPPQSIQIFQGKADAAKLQLLAFENREQETTPPVCEAYDAEDHGPGGLYDHDSYVIRV